MAEMKVKQVFTDGIHNIIQIEIKDNNGRTMYANLPAYSNQYTAADVARRQLHGV